MALQGAAEQGLQCTISFIEPFPATVNNKQCVNKVAKAANEEHKELLRLITKNKEKLQATFSDEQRELFSKYTDCIQAFQTISECLMFQNSFRLGAKIMLEVMEE